MSKLVRGGDLQLPGGVVRGLNLRPSAEPEAVLFMGELQVPRLVAPGTMVAQDITIDFDAIRQGLKEHTTRAAAELDSVALGRAYALLEQLCQQFSHDALQKVHQSKAPLWHHKLLLTWMAYQSVPSHERIDV